MRWTWAPIFIQLLAVPLAVAGDKVSFNRSIWPIFAEHCLECHGPDSNRREADLRLDVEPAANESVIVAGKPELSELFRRIVSADPDLRMPPGKRPPLGKEHIRVVRQWIAEGAQYERHWAFQPIADPRPPEATAGLGAIDRFIVAKLKARGLRLSKRVTKNQLIRRATFDLTGLPPTWDEVTAFVNDSSPQAFEKVVDRLLNSRAYGERWGRHWLDIARYADTHGGAAIGFKKFAFSYTYRDYVIKAFNDDLPYDQFITQQLAADQLGLAENAPQLAALGFLTVGMQFRNPHDTIDDQIDVVTRGLMGLTVACARCHDHKYDAIPTKDYYSLYATLASSHAPEPLPIIGKPESTDELHKYQSDLKQLQISYVDLARDQTEVMRGRLRMQVGLYLREIAKGVPEQDLSTTNIFSYRTDDLRPHVLQRWQRYLAAMPETDAVFGPWRKLSKLTSEEFAHRCIELMESLKLENGKTEGELHKLSAKTPRWNSRVLDALLASKPTSMLEVADAYGNLFAEVHREWLQSLLETSLEAIPGSAPVPDEDLKHVDLNSPVNRQLRRHLYGHESPTNVPASLARTLLNRPVKDNLSGRLGAIHNLNLSSPGSPPRAMALVERPETEPIHVFNRGNPIDRGDVVTPRFLTVLGGHDRLHFTPGARRLSLAKSIIDPANPLTRRVIVNWVWQRHFGQALVRTPDDFGTRGRRPTHPKLLDYLASRLLEDGWSLKKLHRRIMLTNVYRQASVERPAARIADVDNELLWRMPRRRLELEAMRDAMLVASGELEAEMGGRPFELLAKPTVPRRSVYAFVNRDIVAPLMSTFDAANPNACTAKRPDTNVPQQTLFALNSDFIQDRAAAMAKSVLKSNPATSYPSTEARDAERVRELYRRTVSREPDEEEIAAAVAFLRSPSARGDQDAIEPWQRLAHVLLAANEFVFVD